MRLDALNDVVAVITGAPVFAVLAVDQKRAMVTRSLFGPVASRSWRHDCPAEAVEALSAHDMWPMEWLDEASGVRWWREDYMCDGCYRDLRGSSAPGCVECERANNFTSAASTATPNEPMTILDLVTVASMGVVNLHRIVELARIIEPYAVVVWRVMKPEALQEHHRECEERRNDSSAALVFSREARDDEWGGVLRERDGRKRWQEKCPYHGWFGSGGDDDPQGVHRAWPALRELHALGVHLVGHTPRSGDAPGHVVIGVEALP